MENCCGNGGNKAVCHGGNWLKFMEDVLPSTEMVKNSRFGGHFMDRVARVDDLKATLAPLVVFEMSVMPKEVVSPFFMIYPLVI